MNAPILRAATALATALIGSDFALDDQLVTARVRHDLAPWAFAVFEGEEPPDSERLAALVACGSMGMDVAEQLLFRNPDEAREEAKHSEKHGTPGEIASAIGALHAVETRYSAKLTEWLAALHAADDALNVYAYGSEPKPARRKPSTAATSSLPAYYPVPLEDRDTAKARQDAGINAHRVEAARVQRARRALRQQRTAEIDATGGENALRQQLPGALEPPA